MRRSAVLEGYFGMRNVGDDAFCLVAAKDLPERFGYRHLAVIASDHELPVLPPVARGVLPSRPLTRGHVRAATMAAKLRHRTVLHVGGSTFRRMNKRRRDEARLLRSRRVSCHALSVSVGPFRSSTDEREIAEFLKRFQSVSLRDHGSYERARAMSLDLPITQSFDLAVLAHDRLPSRLPIEQRTRPRLGVALRLFESTEGGDVATEQRRNLCAVDMLKALADKVDYELDVLAFNCHPTWGDVGLAHEIASALESIVPSRVIAYERDVASMFSAVNGCDAVLAMRLHAGIFAYASRVPFAMIDYHPKCREFGESIGLPSKFIFSGDGSDLAEHTTTIGELLTNDEPSLLPLATARSMALAAFDFLEAHHDC
jgi:polysaccharide pyruvyl transferase WcaK-like protein